MLHPTKMARVEVIAPSDRVDAILRSVGRLGVAHFINIPAVKAQKYEGVAEEVERSEKEDNLAHISNRINNTMKKLRQVPYPEPVTLKGEPAAVLREIEEQLKSIEVKVAEVENLMKEVAENKASLEHDLTQFHEDFQEVKKSLSEHGLDLSTLSTIDRKALADREIIKDLHGKLLEIQKTLVFIDMAGKLTLPQGELPHDETGLRETCKEINETLALTEKTLANLPESRERIAKLATPLREAKDVVEKKLEAIDKRNTARMAASNLKREMESLNERLSREIVFRLGDNFWASIRETIKVLDTLDGLTLGSTSVEEAIRGISKNAQDVMHGFEVLLDIDRYLPFQGIYAIISAVRGEPTSEIAGLLEGSKRLLAVAPLPHLKILERALNILDMTQRIKTLSEEHPKLLKRLEEIAGKAMSLYAYDEIVDIELRLEELKRRFRRTAKTTIFEIWLKKFDVQRVTEVMKEVCPGVVLNVAGEEKGDKPPSILRHPALARCYERLVEAYGLPNYYELDPTIIMVLSFPLIFGMMFGDMGHGLIVLVGGFLIKPVFDKYKITGEMWDPLYKGRVLIIACGITSIVFGFLYGDFFGATFAHNPLYPNGPHWYTALTGFSEPPWFSPSELEFGGPIKLLKLAIIVGIIQIIFGIVLDVFNKLQRKKYKKILGPLSWLWFYGGLAFLILTRGLGIGRILTDEPVTFVIFLVVPFAGMMALHIFAEGPMEGFSEAIMKAIESISNTASYGRIMALGLVHSLFSMLALMGWGSLAFIPVFIVVTLFMVIALEGIITFAHTLRLHWIEWFSKFYGGDGVQFESFQIERKFTAVP